MLPELLHFLELLLRPLLFKLPVVVRVNVATEQRFVQLLPVENFVVHLSECKRVAETTCQQILKRVRVDLVQVADRCPQ